MDTLDAKQALAQTSLRPKQIEPILGGWASWTFDLDGEWIVRFPRNEVIARCAEREERILPWLNEQVSFAVPVPRHEGSWNGRPFFAYRKIVGRGLTGDDIEQTVIDGLRAMLIEFHDVSVSAAAERLDIASPSTAWRERYEGIWAEVEDVALPAMDPALADRVRRAFDAFMSLDFDFPNTLIHCDLGLEHILVDDVTSLPVGIIDFEEIGIGDPAIDLVPLRAQFPGAVFDRITAGRDLGDHEAERFHFYRWMGSVHAVLHGITEDEPAILRDGLHELPLRLGAPVT